MCVTNIFKYILYNPHNYCARRFYHLREVGLREVGLREVGLRECLTQECRASESRAQVQVHVPLMSEHSVMLPP
jgi:hypothetical protein